MAHGSSKLLATHAASAGYTLKSRVRKTRGFSLVVFNADTYDEENRVTRPRYHRVSTESRPVSIKLDLLISNQVATRGAGCSWQSR